LLALADVPQAEEGREMVSEDQDCFFCRKIEDATLAGGGLLGKYVDWFIILSKYKTP
jgi:hypothetical protein